MYVKLVNPRTGQAMVFKCDLEAYYERQKPMTAQEIDKRQTWLEVENYDARHLLIWHGGREDNEKIEVSEIYIPLPAGKQKCLLTNWDAYLVNDSGRTIERIYRYVEPVDIPA